MEVVVVVWGVLVAPSVSVEVGGSGIVSWFDDMIKEGIGELEVIVFVFCHNLSKVWQFVMVGSF